MRKCYVRVYRHLLNIKQKDFADLVGISRTALSDIETCKSIPRLDTAIKICKVLKYPLKDIDFLFGFRGCKND